MKKELTNLFTRTKSETSEISTDQDLHVNRKSFEVLSEFGIVCGVFIGNCGLLMVLTSSIFEASTKINNIGCILLFFSLILILIGISEKYKTVEHKESADS